LPVGGDELFPVAATGPTRSWFSTSQSSTRPRGDREIFPPRRGFISADGEG